MIDAREDIQLRILSPFSPPLFFHITSCFNPTDSEFSLFVTRMESLSYLGRKMRNSRNGGSRKFARPWMLRRFDRLVLLNEVSRLSRNRRETSASSVAAIPPILFHPIYFLDTHITRISNTQNKNTNILSSYPSYTRTNKKENHLDTHIQSTHLVAP